MASPWRLDGKVALVTGSTRGIGWSTAELLAEQGATVIINGLSNPDLVADRARELTDRFGGEAFGLPYDVADSKQVQQAFQAIFKQHKRLDILVNNAGVLSDAFLGMIPDETIEQVLAVNTRSVLLHLQQASRLMRRAKSGSIVNLTSIIGRVGNEGQTVYGASKAAVIGATLSAAKELAPSNIRVNAVAPGFIDTEMTRSLPPDKYDERMAGIKMGRIGTPQEVAGAILFLASDLSSYVTGQVVGVDGGMLV
ncbi:MAG: SDR family oxidoreductase [Acidobacteria bacterium]|nr:SDR family oxidoreductase [Acidobacteriota bacterium]